MSLISIVKGSITLAGLLHRPNTTGKAPGLVVVHPGGGVKEQTANTYALRLSQQGYVSVAFDASHQGASGGVPHYLEDPNARVSDVSAVVDYLQGLDYVDANAIAVLGICAGGGYGVAAATTDHRIKAVVSVSGVNIGDNWLRGWLGDLDPADYTPTLDQIAQQIQAESQGGNVTFLPYLPTPDETTAPDLVDAWDYYRTPRGFYPTSENKMVAQSVPLITRFDAWQFADLYLKKPALFIAGESADSKWNTDIIYDIVKDTNPDAKKIIVPGGRHMDFYDREEYVAPTITNVTEFLNSYLGRH